MMISRIHVIAASAAVALGCSLLFAQESHNDAPAGIPLQTTYDVSSLKYTPEERKNIDMAVAYYRDCVQSHNIALRDKFLAKDEINHNPNDPKTPEGLMAMLHSRFPNVDPPHKQIDPLPNLLIAKDNMVLIMYDSEDKDPRDPSKTYKWSRFEMLRFQNGKIQEHWDVGDRRVNSQNWKLEWCTKSGRKDCPAP
jgi:predicted SnoaL-like aldol condensation-catalyzing enzyme